jgi:small-conductance mechanosensitive channel
VLVLIQRLLYGVINNNVQDVERRHTLRVWTRLIVGALAIATVVAIWLPRGGTVVQVLALLTAGLALTLSRPITSVLAWLVISVRVPFRVGDRIEVNGVRGDVVDIGLLHMHLLELGNWIDADQTTGRIVHIPNSVIFDFPLFNATESFDLIWNELEFVVTHDSDWERAREIILAEAQPIYESLEQRAIEASERISRRYAYQKGITTPYVFVKLLRDGIRLSLRYLADPRGRRVTSHQIFSGVLRAFRDEPNIHLAPQGYRIYLSDSEQNGGDTASIGLETRKAPHRAG